MVSFVMSYYITVVELQSNSGIWRRIDGVLSLVSQEILELSDFTYRSSYVTIKNFVTLLSLLN